MAARQVAMTSVVSGVLWFSGAVVVLVGVVTGIYGLPAVGLLLAGAGGVCQIRAFVLRCEDRMHEAFQSGRDYERAQQDATLRPVRH